MNKFIEEILPIITSLPFRLVIVFLLWRLILYIEKKWYKKVISIKKTIKRDFQHACLKAIITFVAALVGLFQFEFIQNSAGVVLSSTGLLVALIGFCFQEAFANVIHGIILVMSEHFQVGNRVTFQYNGETITGIICGMDMRCVKVEDIITSSIHLVPNSIMDKNIVQNFHITNNKPKKYLLTAEITYESDIDKAIKIMQETIASVPQYVDTRTEEDIKNGVPAVKVMVRNFASSGIEIVGTICTKTIEENFTACSETRRLLLKNFKENGIEFAYPHMEVIQKKEKSDDIVEIEVKVEDIPDCDNKDVIVKEIEVDEREIIS